MYPTGCVPPQILWLPKIHTYQVLKPLVGISPYHINSTHDFVEQVKHSNLAPGQCLNSYDVSALFI